MVAAADFATRGSDTIPALTVADHTSEALPKGAGTSGDASNRSCGNTQAASRGSSHGRVPAWSSDDESAPSKTEEHAAPRFKVLLGEPALFFTVPRQSGKPVSLTQANVFGAEQAALALWHVLLELVAYAIGTPALTSSTRSSVSPRMTPLHSSSSNSDVTPNRAGCDSPSAAGSLQEDSLPRTVKRLLSGLSRNISRRQAASTIVWVVLPFLAVLCATLVAQQHREIPAPVTPPLESSGDVPVISVDPSVLAEIMGGVSDAREKNLVPTFVPETVKGVLKDGGSHSQSSLSVVGTVKGDLTLAADWRTVKSGTKKVSKLTAQSSCSAFSASSVPKDAAATDAQPQRGSMSLKLLAPSSLSVYSSSHAPETAVRRRSPRVPFSLKNDTGEAAEPESDVGNGGATSGTREETKPGAFDSASTQERKREDEAKPKISVGEFHAWSENLRKPIRRIRNAIVDVSSWWVRYLRRTVRGLFVGSDGKVRAREWVKAAASRAKEIRGRVEEAVEAWWTGVFATGEGAEYEAVLAKEQRKRAKKERKEQKKKARKERKKRRAALREARRAARRQARNRKYAYDDDRADFDHDDDDDYDDDDWHDEHCDGFECRSHRAGRALREWGIAANKAATRLQEDAARKLQEATQLMEDTLANWIAWRG
ncbi:hypothetical protein DFJ73DRAFT_816442 [Zopfochytrium polystomum]|nr:hypothetical protein DFJ73DRAFT_816442 [Zopfochytrium polystomum]